MTQCGWGQGYGNDWERKGREGKKRNETVTRADPVNLKRDHIINHTENVTCREAIDR